MYVYRYRAGKFVTTNLDDIKQLAFLYPELTYKKTASRDEAVEVIKQGQASEKALLDNWAYCGSSFFFKEKIGGWASVINGSVASGPIPQNLITVDSCEVYAIYSTLLIAFNMGIRQLTILTEAQHAILLVSTHVQSSIDPQLMDVIRQYLKLIEVTFIWTPSHDGFYWNEIITTYACDARGRTLKEIKRENK